ncbi:hypothetical protein A6F49_13955 [Enteractinococcus helveticum]|uniref:DUF4145 domain-containing protein n=2 Tax=Enteractinococcus helveticum TaxID=1837282 RepID=A0A1B7LXJ6_9MICC|nr:hypothetical protein A6F49_13955 [Enteractinococcus helveticum]
MQCSACLGRSIAFTVIGESPARAAQLDDVEEFWRENKPADVAPQWVEGKIFKHVPKYIAKAASEAYKCHGIGAYMSAILMARTSIEAAAKDNKVESGSLATKIDKLADDGLIRKTIKDAAHQVRLFGNDMAHGDIEIEATENDSAQILRLLTMVFEDSYEVVGVMGEVGISLEVRKSGGVE